MHIDSYRAGDVGLAELNNEVVTDESSTPPTGSLTLSAMTGNLTLVKGLEDTTVLLLVPIPSLATSESKSYLS